MLVRSRLIRGWCLREAMCVRVLRCWWATMVGCGLRRRCGLGRVLILLGITSLLGNCPKAGGTDVTPRNSCDISCLSALFAPQPAGDRDSALHATALCGAGALLALRGAGLA